MSELPPHIKKAIANGDVEFLSYAGKKGGKATAHKNSIEQVKKKDIEETKELLAAEIKLLEAQMSEWRRKLSTNEHLLTPDGETIEDEEPDDED